MDYKFLPLSSKYIPGLVRLLDSSFHIQSSPKSKLVFWKYLDPYLKNRSVIRLALFNKTVVSHYANIPIPISINTNLYKSMQCVDMITHPQHRRKGLINKLANLVYSEIRRRGYDFSIGFSTDSGILVDKYSSAYGYKIVGVFSQYFKLVLTSPNPKLVINEVNTFLHETRNLSNTHLAITKDLAYLNWRYIKKPEKKWKIFFVPNAGYIVLVKCHIRCFIYDLIPLKSKEVDLEALMQAAHQKAYELNCRLLCINLFPNSFWKKSLTKFGFLNNPIVNHHFYLTVKIHNPKLDPSFILNSSNWLLLGGDII